MIDPAHTVHPGGKQASVPFDPNRKAEGDIPPALEREVRAFIALNHDALMKEWNREFASTREFLDAVRPLSN
jgi:hypothetical protein